MDTVLPGDDCGHPIVAPVLCFACHYLSGRCGGVLAGCGSRATRLKKGSDRRLNRLQASGGNGSAKQHSPDAGVMTGRYSAPQPLAVLCASVADRRFYNTQTVEQPWALQRL